jgi:hypothetical protein
VSTVARRCISSTPARDAHSTWLAIVELLTQGRTGADRDVLLAAGGVAASIIADKAPQGAPIVVTCDGPRTRVYCLYDDDAVEGSDANEDTLGFDPLAGDWAVSLPCPAEDLDWVRAALKGSGGRVTARDAADGHGIAETAGTAASAGSLVLDREGFLGS